MKAISILFITFLVNLSGYSQNWDSLRGGINNDPTKFYVDSLTDKLYVGGIFKKADHKWINGIGSWDGDQWDSLGHGIDFFSTAPTSIPGNTWGIVRYGNYLYAAGVFIKAGNTMTYGLARWDGTNWDSVPGGRIPYPSGVLDMITYNNELYICGAFDSVGNIAANGVAKWDGTTWSAIGSNYQFFGQSGWLSKMEFYRGNLYVGGQFYDTNGDPCRLAKWDGSNWQFMTADLQGSITNVAQIQVYNDELYVSGLFYASAGNAGTSIMRWNDTTWRSVGGSVQIVNSAYPQVANMCVHNGKLYCVGNFERIGGVNAKSLASWDGTNWCGYGTTFDNTVTQIAFFHDTMYVGGGFWHVDGDSIPNMAKWIGGSYVDSCGFISSVDSQPLNNFSVNVFPNPTSETATFQFTGLTGKAIIRLYDALGREVWSENVNGSQSVFSAAGQPVGMYFYRIEQDGEIKAAGKLIIQ